MKAVLMFVALGFLGGIVKADKLEGDRSGKPARFILLKQDQKTKATTIREVTDLHPKIKDAEAMEKLSKEEKQEIAVASINAAMKNPELPLSQRRASRLEGESTPACGYGYYGYGLGWGYRPFLGGFWGGCATACCYAAPAVYYGCNYYRPFWGFPWGGYNYYWYGY